LKEKEIVKAIKQHVKEQDDRWKFVAGREVVTKRLFLQKIDGDKQFRRMVVDMVHNLSIDILTRKGKSDV